MKTYNVYRHPVHGSQALKVGFSWPAFFFYIPWMLAKKLWTHAALWLLMSGLMNASESYAERYFDVNAQAGVYSLTLMASLALWLVPAFQGNKWRETNLRKRGYLLAGMVNGTSPDM